MILAGLLTVLAIVAVFFKLSPDTKQKLLGYDIALDILVTGFLAWLLAGTYSGMMAAIVGGLAFSLTLIVSKFFIGYQRFSWNNRKWITSTC